MLTFEIKGVTVNGAMRPENIEQCLSPHFESLESE